MAGLGASQEHKLEVKWNKFKSWLSHQAWLSSASFLSTLNITSSFLAWRTRSIFCWGTSFCVVWYNVRKLCNKSPSVLFLKSLLWLTVNINPHLGSLWRHSSGHACEGVFSLDWLSRKGHPSCGWHYPTGWGLGRNRKANESWVPAFLSLPDYGYNVTSGLKLLLPFLPTMMECTGD